MTVRTLVTVSTDNGSHIQRVHDVLGRQCGTTVLGEGMQAVRLREPERTTDLIAHVTIAP